MYQYGGWGYPPQTPVIIPPQTPTPPDPLTEAIRQVVQQEVMKKFFKEEKKDEKKDDKGKKPEVSVFSIALLLVLLSPITGPVMSHFFKWGLSFLH